MCLLLILSNKLDLNQETRFTIHVLSVISKVFTRKVVLSKVGIRKVIISKIIISKVITSKAIISKVVISKVILKYYCNVI